MKIVPITHRVVVGEIVNISMSMSRDQTWKITLLCGDYAMCCCPSKGPACMDLDVQISYEVMAKARSRRCSWYSLPEKLRDCVDFCRGENGFGIHSNCGACERIDYNPFTGAELVWFDVTVTE